MTSISSQKTVTSAGTAEALGSQIINAPLMVKALSANTGAIAIGNDGSDDVTISNGLLLSADDVVIFDYVGCLSSIYIDAENDGEGVSWLILNV
jgi:hypothetical protein